MAQQIHIVQTRGYTHCTQFTNLKEAREFLRAIVAASLKSARRLSKTATKHKLGEDNYSITLSSDHRSNLCIQHHIVTL